MRSRHYIFIILLAFVFILILSCQQFDFAYADTGLGAELVTNGGAESNEGGIFGWHDDTEQSRWNSSTTYLDWASPVEGSYYFYLYNPSMETPLPGTMSQEITLSGTEGSGLFSSISDGNVSINFNLSMFQKISADNEAKAILEQYNAGGALLKTSQVVNTTATGAMGSYQISTQVDPNARKFKVILSATLTKGGYAQFDRVSLKLIDASSGSAPVFGSDFPTTARTDAGVTYSTPFTISDADAGDVDHLTFSSSTTNVNLVPAANITVSGSGGSRTLTIVPTGNLSGEADITVSASDGTKSAEKTFHFIVQKIISMDTNLVENGNGTSGLASWSGNTVNITGTGSGFSTSDHNASMYQNIDISRYYALIDSGVTDFLMSATFPGTYGSISAQFYTDIACTNPVGGSYSVNKTASSLQQTIPANAKGVKITFSNTSGSDTPVVIVQNISFKIVNNFPKLAAISTKTTLVNELTVPVYAYYTTDDATISAVSGDQTVVANAGITAGGSGFNRTITFTPLKAGSTTITVTLSDGTHAVSTGFTVNAVLPTVVTGVTSPAAGYYAEGGNLDFTVRFSQSVTGGTDSELPLTIGGDPVNAGFYSQSGDSITYRYTIDGGDSGVVAIGSEIDDLASPITDTVDFPAETAIGTAASTGITVIQAPVLSSSAAGGHSTYGERVTFTAALNCPDPLAGTVQFKVNGSNLGTARTVSGNAAAYEIAETEIKTGSVTVSAVFVPGDASIHVASLTSNSIDLTVDKKNVSIGGLSAIQKAYDGTTDVSLTGGAITGALAGDDLAANIPTTGSTVQKSVGTRSVTFTPIVLSGGDAGNYNLTAQPDVDVEILPKSVTPAAIALDKVYDGTADAVVQFSFVPGDIITGDTVTVSAIGAFADANAATAAKAVSLNGLTTGGANKDNYIINLPAVLSAFINLRDIEITPDPVTKVYGQADPALTYKITSGTKVTGETLTGLPERATGENIGDYAILQGTLTSANNPNYNISFVPGNSLTVSPETPVITVSADKTVQMTGKDVVVSATLTYPNRQASDAYPATLTFTAINAVLKSPVTAVGNVYSQTFTMGDNLTTGAAFQAAAAANGNYSGASSATPATVAIIDRYTPGVTVDSDKTSGRSTYGDVVTFTAAVSDSNGIPRGTVQFYIDGVAFGSEVALTPNGTAGTAVVTAGAIAATPLSAGNRSITATYTPAADETDYKASTSSAYALTIDKKSVSITGLTAVSKVYDGTTQVGLTGGAISGTLTGAAVTANIPVTGTVPTKNTGTDKSVSFPVIVLSGSDKDNYVLNSQPTVTVAIMPKAIPALAVVSDKTYDGTTDAAVQFSFAPGDIVTGDVVTASATGAFADAAIGTGKAVTLIGFTPGGTSKDNYEVSMPANLTAAINPRNIEVTPDSVAKEYGQADPKFTYQFTDGSLVSGESLTGALSRISGENTGSFEITQGTLTDINNPNYSIRFVSGPALTIAKAAPMVIVTSDHTSGNAVYGNPVVFTATVSGAGIIPEGNVRFLRNGTAMGTEAVLTNGTASLTPAAGQMPAGSHSITAEYTPSAGELNYKASTSSAYSFTVDKKDVIVKAADITIYLGDAIPDAGALTYSAIGLVGSDTLATLPTLSLPANVTSSAVTAYAISVTGAEAGSNYTVRMVDGTLYVENRSGGDSSRPKPEITTETNVAQNIVTVTANTNATVDSQGNATANVTANQLFQTMADALTQAAAMGEDTKTIVEIQVKGAENADAVTAVIPEDAFRSLARSDADGFKLSTPVGSMIFDTEALSVINQNSGGNVSLKIERLDPVSLPEEARAAVGDRPVFDFTVTSGGGRVSDFGEGTVKVNVPYTLKDDEDPNQLVVYYVADSGELTVVPECIYDPETKTVTAVIKHFSVYAVGYNGVGFTDVTGWYKDYVNFLASRKIINGTSGDTFSPNSSITRAQFVTILANMAGADLSRYSTSAFSDVKTGAWYAGAVQWAYENSVASGTGGKFNPNENVNREQMAVMLYNYAKLSNRLGTGAASGAADRFNDSSNISKWAEIPVNWGVSAGIFNGSDKGELLPQHSATRAEAAKIITVFLKGNLN